ncbi:Nucleoside-diphosphate-sugar epimerase [Pseudomonas syringae pv. actinidiae]|uniref:Nucleoside-diphosphate-sugar epimerase n=1 Tax=Pseudomonas syringae pv. actinidiae TaxID=103796 RepID=A0A2V0Q456_PSESF|nr:Nucleoside-diphosphate-sugar epimerase [Pseudomonas syringae pv. actinidiae]
MTTWISVHISLVGASRATLRLLAKRPVQPLEIGRLHQHLREQARSHTLRAEICQ